MNNAEPPEGIEFSEWGKKGYARAMAICTDAKASGEYPTQDKYSAQNEADFIQGFNLGMAIFKSEGFNTVEAYGEEHEIAPVWIKPKE